VADDKAVDAKLVLGNDNDGINNDPLLKR